MGKLWDRPHRTDQEGDRRAPKISLAWLNNEAPKLSHKVGLVSIEALICSLPLFD